MDSSLGQHRTGRYETRGGGIGRLGRNTNSGKLMLLAVTGSMQGTETRDKMRLLSMSISNSPAMDEGLELYDIPSNSTSIFMCMSDVAS